jgi:hypothetical protein
MLDNGVQHNFWCALLQASWQPARMPAPTNPLAVAGEKIFKVHERKSTWLAEIRWAADGRSWARCSPQAATMRQLDVMKLCNTFV